MLVWREEVEVSKFTGHCPLCETEKLEAFELDGVSNCGVSGQQISASLVVNP